MSASDSDDDGSTIPTLCERCFNIPFDLFLGEQRTYKLYSSRLELETSAEHCAACELWDSTIPEYYRGEVLLHRGSESPVILSNTRGTKILSALEKDVDEISIPLTCRAEISGQRGRSWGEADYYTSSSLSRDSIDLMRALMDECIKSHDHPLCKGVQEFSDAPSRLLFLGDVTDPRLRVIRTSELSKVPVYVALSHCWGRVAEDAPWKLNSTTVVEFQHEVPEKFLPQTFVDAVKVTRALGQSYF
jgi:hypothetical protein